MKNNVVEIIGLKIEERMHSNGRFLITFLCFLLGTLCAATNETFNVQQPPLKLRHIESSQSTYIDRVHAIIKSIAYMNYYIAENSKQAMDYNNLINAIYNLNDQHDKQTLSYDNDTQVMDGGDITRANTYFVEALAALSRGGTALSLPLLERAYHIYKDQSHGYIVPVSVSIAYAYHDLECYDKAIESYSDAIHSAYLNHQQLAPLLVGYLDFLFQAERDDYNPERYLARIKEVLTLYKNQIVDREAIVPSNRLITQKINNINYYSSMSLYDDWLDIQLGQSAQPNGFWDPTTANRYIYYYALALYHQHPKVAAYDHALYAVNQAMDLIPQRYGYKGYRQLIKCFKLKSDVAFALGATSLMYRCQAATKKLYRKLCIQQSNQNLAQELMQEKAPMKSLENTSCIYHRSQYMTYIGWVLISTIILCLFTGVYMMILFHKNKVKLTEIFILKNNYENHIKIITEKNKNLVAVNQVLQYHNQAKQKLIDRLKRFSFLVVHDLKEPIRTIGSYSGLIELKAGQKLDANEKEYLQMLKNSALRLNDMLDILRVFNENSLSTIERFSIIDMNKVVSSVQDHLGLIIDRTDCRLIINGKLPKIYGQKELMIQVFQNIFSNAIKYSHPEKAPQIWITTKRRGESHLITIEDNGIGIPNEDLTKVFTLFKRSSNTNQVSGQGIGLAMVKEIVELHEGTVKIKNRQEGGICITIQLPVQAIHRAVASKYFDAPYEKHNFSPIYIEKYRVDQPVVA